MIDNMFFFTIDQYILVSCIFVILLILLLIIRIFFWPAQDHLDLDKMVNDLIQLN